MTVTVAGTPQTFTFTASGTVCTYTGGGTTTNSIDVLCINSDNTVTVSGFTAAVSAVSQQGAYIFTCDAGTASSATITLGGGIASNTQVSWLRITGTSGVDTPATATAQINNTAGTVTPSATSGSLAGSQELVIAFAPLHHLDAGGAPTSPVWSSGYTQQTAATIGSGATGVYGNVAVKTPAGTAAESPSLSWTTPTSDRYMMIVAFVAAVVSSTVTPNSLAVPVSLGSPTVTQTMTVTPTSLSVPITFGSPRVAAQGVAPASWQGLDSVVNEARAVHRERERRNADPIECPEHHWPLTPVEGGGWHCLFGGHVVYRGRG